MAGIQIGLVIFFIFVLGIICHDEVKKVRQQRKTSKLNRFWHHGRERRKTVRLDTEIAVSYEVVAHNKAQKHLSRTTNISIGGINLALEEKLPPNTVLSLHFNIPQSAQTLNVKGKVIWAKEILAKFVTSGHQRFFATGIKFVYLSKKDEVVLDNFIRQSAKQPRLQTVS
ncbi:PilZ domain-containing protein [Candidatus Omnitrophota bacterium]